MIPLYIAHMGRSYEHRFTHVHYNGYKILVTPMGYRALCGAYRQPLVDNLNTAMDSVDIAVTDKRLNTSDRAARRSENRRAK